MRRMHELIPVVGRWLPARVKVLVASFMQPAAV
jgi:hypothetical protein